MTTGGVGEKFAEEIYHDISKQFGDPREFYGLQDDTYFISTLITAQNEYKTLRCILL